jgi:hypothetical protein
MAKQIHSGTGHNIDADNVFINSIPKISSDLTAVVNALGKKLFFPDIESDNEITTPFDPEKKIQYNNVIKFKAIIQNYKSYVGKLSSIYKEFDTQGTNKTHIVLENIKLAYIKEKAALLARNEGKQEIDVIRAAADNIIDNVEDTLLIEIKTSSNIETSSETINLSLQIVLIDAFIRCKILEEPI